MINLYFFKIKLHNTFHPVYFEIFSASCLYNWYITISSVIAGIKYVCIDVDLIKHAT